MSVFSFESNLYIFGGWINGKRTSKDFYKFSLKTHCWEELSKKHEDYEFTPRFG